MSHMQRAASSMVPRSTRSPRETFRAGAGQNSAGCPGVGGHMLRRPRRWPALIALSISACAVPTPCPPIDVADGRGPSVPAGSVDPRELEFAPELNVDLDLSAVLLEGLHCLDEAVGGGEEAVPGATLTVHYTGYMAEGTIFDTSRARGPFDVLLGAGQVIPGWDLGLVGMRVGERRQLVIPPHLAYGTRGAGGVIPPNATLVFEVELVAMD